MKAHVEPTPDATHARPSVLCASLAIVGALATVGCRDWHELVWGPSKVVREARPSPFTSPPAQEPSSSPTPPLTPSAKPPEPNSTPVARVGARVYFVECQGQVVSGWDSTEARVGCRLHMDCTPRDAYDQPTRAQGPPRWYLSDPRLVTGGSRLSYTPAFTIVGPGTLNLYAELDGVRSNLVTVRLI
jgi:hypothetical protein